MRLAAFGTGALCQTEPVLQESPISLHERSRRVQEAPAPRKVQQFPRAPGIAKEPLPRGAHELRGEPRSSQEPRIQPRKQESSPGSPTRQESTPERKNQDDKPKIKKLSLQDQEKIKSLFELIFQDLKNAYLKSFFKPRTNVAQAKDRCCHTEDNKECRLQI